MGLWTDWSLKPGLSVDPASASFSIPVEDSSLNLGSWYCVASGRTSGVDVGFGGIAVLVELLPRSFDVGSC